MTGLVLSLFPGLDVLGMGFEAEGFSVVAGPDVVWGRDVREFHVPAGRFDGVIGGPPCQTFSTLANLLRAKGLEPRFGDLIPEFVRVVEEARPTWFLMENLRNVPEECWPRPDGYAFVSFLLNNCELDRGDGIGFDQSRVRRLWFGWRDHGDHLDLEGRIQKAALLGGGKQSVTGRHQSNGMGDASRPGAHAGNPPKYTLAEMLRLQGLPGDLLDEAPFTMQGKRKLVGNAVPLPMARELARVVMEVTSNRPTTTEPAPDRAVSGPRSVASCSQDREG